MKRSVLFITNAYPDFDSSYHGIFVKKMATLLKDEGYSIVVVTPKIYEKSRCFEEQDGIKIYRFPFYARNRLLIEYKKIPYLKMVLYYLTGILVTIYAIFRNRCDVIHVHWAIPTGLLGVLAGALLNKPLIVTIHGSDLRMALERPGFLRKIFLFVCKNATHINCVSKVQKKEMEQIGVTGENISTIPMGIDEAFLEKGTQRRQEIQKKPITILSNRNLLPMYNISSLIRAIPTVLKEEPETRFLIAGDGGQKEALEREAQNLKIGLYVKFMGRVSHDVMPDLLSQSDVYVSTSPYDGTSVSLLEAMGSGTFPIVTDIPSNREWISDGENGFLVPVDEERSLAEKIIKAIRNDDLRVESRVKNVRLIKERGVWPVTVEKAKQIYERVLDSKS